MPDEFSRRMAELEQSVAANLGRSAEACQGAAFEPQWSSAPGDTVEDLREERGIQKLALAGWLGLSLDGYEELLRGERAVTPKIARTLSDRLGCTAVFWLRREAQYRADLARLEADR